MFVSGKCIRSRLALLQLLFFSLSAVAQIADPIPGTIPEGVISARVALLVQLPESGSMTRPLGRPMTLVGDGAGRRFVADQNGIVYQLHADNNLSIFLDLRTSTDLYADQIQRGLSSIAFHPNYHNAGSPGAGKFYTASAQTLESGVPDYLLPVGAPLVHHSVIHEWTVSANPDLIDETSVRELLRIEQPYKDHNVGQIAFNQYVGTENPEFGLLYIAMGDGGNVSCCPRPSIDPYFLGQSLTSPLGKMLRIDPLEPGTGGAYSVPDTNPFVDVGDILGEIWAWGLRNPHRFSWDALAPGRMYISDIGQAYIEEINLGESGANYGWSEREGTFLIEHEDESALFTLPLDDLLFGFTYPVVQYDHDEGDKAITGGYVYRASKASDLSGHYIFGDLNSGRVFHVPVALIQDHSPTPFQVLRLIDDDDGQEKTLRDMLGTIRADLRFGRDDEGILYMVTKQDGGIRQLIPNELICDIQMSQAVYVDGETVTASVFRFANATSAAVTIELKTWLGLSVDVNIPLLRLGSDSSFILPPGADFNLGPLPLVPVTAGLPRGQYELSCRMLDPVTGELLTEDLNLFDVQ